MTDDVPRCDTCRFMAAARTKDIFGDDCPEIPHGMAIVLDADELRSPVSEHRTCARIIHGNTSEGYPRAPTEPAVVVDGSGYAARLLVLPTFGCVLHEPGGVAERVEE